MPFSFPFVCNRKAPLQSGVLNKHYYKSLQNQRIIICRQTPCIDLILSCDKAKFTDNVMVFTVLSYNMQLLYIQSFYLSSLNTNFNRIVIIFLKLSLSSYAVSLLHTFFRPPALLHCKEWFHRLQRQQRFRDLLKEYTAFLLSRSYFLFLH